MTKEICGLDTYLFTWPLNKKDEYEDAMYRYSLRGVVTIRFINNRWAFEWKKARRIY